MTEQEWAWLAGIIEGEGCISFAGVNSVRLTVNMTDLDILQRCRALTNCGHIGLGKDRGPRRKPLHRWSVGHQNQIRKILPTIWPWMGKRRSARIGVALTRLAGVRQHGFCKRGHKFTPENSYGHGPRRVCRTCALVRDRLRSKTDARRAWDRARDKDPKRISQKRAAMERYKARQAMLRTEIVKI